MEMLIRIRLFADSAFVLTVLVFATPMNTSFYRSSRIDTFHIDAFADTSRRNPKTRASNKIHSHEFVTNIMFVCHVARCAQVIIGTFSTLPAIAYYVFFSTAATYDISVTDSCKINLMQPMFVLRSKATNDLGAAKSRKEEKPVR